MPGGREGSQRNRMRLRTQLGLFYTVMIGILLALGSLVVWGGPQVVHTFSAAQKDMEKVTQIRSLQVLLARQKASLDTYFLVGDSQELERFEEMSRLVSAKLKEIEKMAPEDKGLQALGAQFNGVLASAQSVVELYRTDKARAFQSATDLLLPRMTRFLEDVNQAGARITREVQEAQERVKRWVALGGRLFLYLGLLGFLVGFVFAVGTFRSMTRSLRLLQEGTAAFGSGQWDFRIQVPGKNELGVLARSFNEMAQNIKQLESQTLHMHRMSAVGQLAGGVAHEINNPLTGVLGQAQILLEKLPPGDPHRAHIEKIERAAVRCKRIVRSLLDFSRQKETPFVYVNINEVIEGTIELCEPDLQSHRVNLMKSLNLAVPSILGNGPQLQQVFLNLATNAIQAMPQGGTLTIATRLGNFPLPAGANGRMRETIEVVFADTGMGIAPEHIRQLFEPFFTTKDIGKGTGLGLSVSLGIVRNHQGDILVESQGRGHGATFRVLLPTSQVGGPAEDPLVGAGAGAQDGRFGTGSNTRY
jgi:signal transduction histidine kinase